MRDAGYPCKRCGESKPASEFSPNRNMKSGLATYCKPCSAQMSREWRQANPEKQREQSRRQFERKQELRPGTHAARVDRWRKANPEHNRLLYIAHQKVRYALLAGKLTRPENCDGCGAGGPIEAHHSDHTKPLDVEWLCRICHRAADKALHASTDT